MSGRLQLIQSRSIEAIGNCGRSVLSAVSYFEVVLSRENSARIEASFWGFLFLEGGPPNPPLFLCSAKRYFAVLSIDTENQRNI
jgi:hypothetical protein